MLPAAEDVNHRHEAFINNGIDVSPKNTPFRSRHTGVSFPTA